MKRSNQTENREGRLSTAASHPSPRVVHVGVVSANAGGMAQVVQDYVDMGAPGVVIEAWRSTRGAGDRSWPIWWLTCVLRVLWTRMSARRDTYFVVHLSQGGSFTREGSLARLISGLQLPVLCHIHGSGFENFAESNARRVRKVLVASNGALCLSSRTASVVRSIAPGVVVHMVSNPVAVPADCDDLLSRGQRVVFGGVVGTRKGADVLLRAWRELPIELRSEWSLELYGPLQMPLAHEDDGAHLRGEVRRADLQAVLSDSQIAVLPSRGEAMPVFILESMARGCAVIGSTVGQIPEMLHAGAGALVDAGDSAGLARQLERLMADEDLRVAMGAAARARTVSDYEQRAVMKRLATIWTNGATNE